MNPDLPTKKRPDRGNSPACTIIYEIGPKNNKKAFIYGHDTNRIMDVTMRFFPYSGLFVTFRLPVGNILCLFGHLWKAAKNPPVAGTPLRGWASTVLSPLMWGQTYERMKRT